MWSSFHFLFLLRSFLTFGYGVFPGGLTHGGGRHEHDRMRIPWPQLAADSNQVAVFVAAFRVNDVPLRCSYRRRPACHRRINWVGNRDSTPRAKE